jgi:hypothetical protein
MKPYFQFPEDKTKAVKGIRKQALSEYNKILKAKKKIATAETQKVYKMFHCFVVGNPQTQVWCTPRWIKKECRQPHLKVIIVPFFT